MSDKNSFHDGKGKCLSWNVSVFLLIGGIIGLGEAEEDRVGLLHTLATLPTHPESVPINALVSVKGTPLQEQKVLLIPVSYKFSMVVVIIIIMIGPNHYLQIFNLSLLIEFGSLTTNDRWKLETINLYEANY
jgi:hypothetical protein